jgi:hypothetical protein
MSINLATAVGEIGKSLHNKGVLPVSLANAKIVEQNRLAAATPRPMVKSPGKIAKQTAKELAAPKVVAKPDAGAARQKLNGYVQTLKNQGQSPNQIKGVV